MKTGRKTISIPIRALVLGLCLASGGVLLELPLPVTCLIPTLLKESSYCKVKPADYGLSVSIRHQNNQAYCGVAASSWC